MAPSATVTVAPPASTATPTLKLDASTRSAYRLIGGTFDKEAEEGKKEYPAAKVCNA